MPADPRTAACGSGQTTLTVALGFLKPSYKSSTIIKAPHVGSTLSQMHGVSGRILVSLLTEQASGNAHLEEDSAVVGALSHSLLEGFHCLRDLFAI